MGTSHAAASRTLIGMLIDERRRLTQRMLAGASFDDLGAFRVLQDAIEAAVQAHAGESEAERGAPQPGPPPAFRPDPRLGLGH